MIAPYPCSGPLRCETVLEVGFATILLSHLPGRTHVDGQGRVWSRDLDADLTALKGWGADAVICLVEPSELLAMGVPDYADAVNNHGMALFHLPITDMSTPGKAFNDAWASRGDELNGLLSGRSRIVVHCAAGLGRSGMFCAELLVRAGWSAKDAIHKVRSVRPGAIETRAQEDYLSALSS
jgi:ADP-ribosyl-[dinitrogen reductase] hydrolase